jgi:hypothetical protein
LSGIRVTTTAKFEDDLEPVLSAHLGMGGSLARFGFIEAVENAHSPLHNYHFIALY